MVAFKNLVYLNRSSVVAVIVISGRDRSIKELRFWKKIILLRSNLVRM